MTFFLLIDYFALATSKIPISYDRVALFQLINDLLIFRHCRGIHSLKCLETPLGSLTQNEAEGMGVWPYWRFVDKYAIKSAYNGDNIGLKKLEIPQEISKRQETRMTLVGGTEIWEYSRIARQQDQIDITIGDPDLGGSCLFCRSLRVSKGIRIGFACGRD
jgi:hypothetical protein